MIDTFCRIDITLDMESNKRPAEEPIEHEHQKIQKLDPNDISIEEEERTEKEWKEYEENVVLSWLRDFDERILTYKDGKLMTYGWGGNTIQKSGYMDLFAKGRSRRYYEKHPDRKEQDEVLCRDICPLSVFHGLVELFEFRPDICYGSYEMQIICHVIKSLLVKFGRDIPTFLKRLLSLYDEEQYKMDKLYDRRAGGNGDIMKKVTKTRLKETPKHLQVTIAIFLTSNFSFMTTREVSSEDGTKYKVPALMVGDIKDPVSLAEIVIRSLFPGKSGWDYSANSMAQLAKYMEPCLLQWREYMYGGCDSNRFSIKAMKAEESISVVSYY